VIVVLAAFAAGIAVGVLAMVPGWWRRRERSAREAPPSAAAPAVAPPSVLPGELGAVHPPREGL
jgi:hypothetical protein